MGLKRLYKHTNTHIHTYTHLLIYICIQIYSNLSLLISFTFLLCIIQIHTWVPTNVCIYNMYVLYIPYAYTHTTVHTFEHAQTWTFRKWKENNKEQWKPKSIKHSTAGVRSKDHNRKKKEKREWEKRSSHTCSQRKVTDALGWYWIVNLTVTWVQNLFLSALETIFAFQGLCLVAGLISS